MGWGVNNSRMLATIGPFKTEYILKIISENLNVISITFHINNESKEKIMNYTNYKLRL